MTVPTEWGRLLTRFLQLSLTVERELGFSAQEADAMCRRDPERFVRCHAVMEALGR